MKIKNIFIISGLLTFLIMVLPVLLAMFVPEMKEFFIKDGFGDITANKDAMRVADTFFDVMAYMSLGIVVTIFGASTITDLDAKRKLSLLFGVMLLLIAIPDYIGLTNGGAHPPAPIMIVNALVYVAFFYGWKKGK
jgi:hypothetical protein